MEWLNKPMVLEYWPEDAKYILGLDENGTSDIKNIKKAVHNKKTIDNNDRNFTLTGVVFNKDSYSNFIKDINGIKYKYWENGLCNYKGKQKRVCFHSREIRKCEYPFNLIDNYPDFLSEITELINRAETKIISCTIDKEEHCKRYIDPHHPYHIAIRFILERYCGRLNQLNEKGIIVLESREKKQNKFVLKHIREIINNGTNFKSKDYFNNLVGVYFNPKLWKAKKEQKSFVILELADLVSYPIHKYAKSGFSEKDLPFQTIEPKFFKFPVHSGSGLKIFP